MQGQSLWSSLGLSGLNGERGAQQLFMWPLGYQLRSLTTTLPRYKSPQNTVLIPFPMAILFAKCMRMLSDTVNKTFSFHI